MATKNIDEHLESISQEQVKNICNPLLLFNIHYFMYYLNLADGREVKVTTHPEVSKFFVNKEYYKISAYTLNPERYERGFYLADYLEDPKIRNALADEFNIGNMISWINPEAEGCEIIHFASTPDNTQINHFYLNHLSLLRKFIIYFKNQASHLLKKSKKESLIIPNRLGRDDLISQHLSSSEQKEVTKFIKQIRIKKYYLDGEFLGVVISAKELDVISQLALGKTSKEIASILHLSPRTVESHIASIKTKLNCHTKSQIIEKSKSLDLLIGELD